MDKANTKTGMGRVVVVDIEGREHTNPFEWLGVAAKVGDYVSFGRERSYRIVDFMQTKNWLWVVIDTGTP